MAGRSTAAPAQRTMHLNSGTGHLGIGCSRPGRAARAGLYLLPGPVELPPGLAHLPVSAESAR